MIDVARWRATHCLIDLAALVAVAVPADVAPAFAQADNVDESTAKQRQAHRQNMRAIAQSIRLFDGPSGQRNEIALAAEPALRYADSTRETHESTLWFWGVQGRPQAALAIEYYAKDKRGSQWLFELVSLSDSKLAAERPGWSWAATKPGLDCRPIPDGPPVGDKPNVRLSQMKSLFRRFSSYELTQVQGRVQLRPLANPLTRYSDSAASILDGAIFAFAHGTNPELLLVIEARKSKDDSVHWYYGMAQMAGAELVGLLDHEEVWRQPNADPVAVRDSYVNGWIPATATVSATNELLPAN